MNVKQYFPIKPRYYKSITYLYIVMVIFVTGVFYKLLAGQPVSLTINTLHSICLLIAITRKMRLAYKYMLALLAIIFLYVSLSISYVDLIDLSFVAFYLPLLYTYLLPDILSPIIFSILFSGIFYSYSDTYSSEQILGNTIGIISAATLYSVLSFLVARLYDSREMYKELSIRDSLTKLYNLDYVVKIGDDMLSNGKNVTIFVFDLDYFKSFNDTYGHLLGNNVLIQVAEKIEEEVSTCGGLAARLGGDEFITFVPELSDDEADALFKRISLALSELYIVSDPELEPVKISLSMGMAHSVSSEAQSIRELLNIADMNMYYHKHTKLYDLRALHTQDLEYVLNEEEKQLLKVLSEKDMYSYIHSKYVVQYTSWILDKININEVDKVNILKGAWLHDIGKLFISNEILRKSSNLSESEYSIVKEHVQSGVHLIQKFNISVKGINAIKYHHERWDGAGYPDGVKGEMTPIEGRVLQLADAFSAMTVKRVYRKVNDLDSAILEIKKNKATQFDPQLVDLFVEIVEEKLKQENLKVGA
ncbi:diguanylate cyclase [Bacillus sp. HMF5848]|uniref:bifunctional diguanylate cyclase/phosphohydrolase n=1 Tax=Bacillus sp. HMF5848 TaxID=2495421 RepID=UPI000F7B6DE6|nr:diguanylate cyclase [Bacillus sp. HMF5848]RSK25983.1 diguanylate cyclase [Bacillus sp. HMF5848]